jgi:hypothetical protein
MSLAVNSINRIGENLFVGGKVALPGSSLNVGLLSVNAKTGVVASPFR